MWVIYIYREREGEFQLILLLGDFAALCELSFFFENFCPPLLFSSSLFL